MEGLPGEWGGWAQQGLKEMTRLLPRAHPHEEFHAPSEGSQSGKTLGPQAPGASRMFSWLVRLWDRTFGNPGNSRVCDHHGKAADTPS